jgi:4-hydroxymandelate oxidase
VISDAFVNLGELEAAARERLPPGAFDYYASGANDEITLRENILAYQRITLRYRVLVDVSTRDASTTILGVPHRVPILIAPMAFQRLAHPDGELATARAASAAGIGMVLSSFTTTSVDDVRASTTAPLWLQLYVYKEREATRALVERAEAAGCTAVVLTVDAPLIGRRERDVRNRFALPPELVVSHGLASVDRTLEAPAEAPLHAYVTRSIDPTVSWRDIDWLRSVTRLPIILKGIVRADDGRRAVEHGASGIVVSNHGGRQLDTAPATITALREVVEAVDGRGEVLIDGGVRRGTDIVKAIALGARGVLIGRPVLWGLALDGEHGVRQVLEMLAAELDLAMALCGCPTLREITPDLLGARPA